MTLGWSLPTASLGEWLQVGGLFLDLLGVGLISWGAFLTPDEARKVAGIPGAAIGEELALEGSRMFRMLREQSRTAVAGFAFIAVGIIVQMAGILVG